MLLLHLSCCLGAQFLQGEYLLPLKFIFHFYFKYLSEKFRLHARVSNQLMGSQSTSVLVYKRCEISTKTVYILETKFSNNHLQGDCHGFGETLCTFCLNFQKKIPIYSSFFKIAKALTNKKGQNLFEISTKNNVFFSAASCKKRHHFCWAPQTNFGPSYFVRALAI